MKYYQKNGILIKKDSLKTIKKIDAIIFDCDGVLVDVSKSYDLAIKNTTKHVLDKFQGIRSISISPQIISGFKATGGFNDEVDVTYASILSLVAAKRLRINPKIFINKVIKNADSTGIRSVEKFLDSTSVNISDIRQQLQYPGPHSSNPLYQIFDQMFYGQKLYKKIFHQKSQFKMQPSTCTLRPKTPQFAIFCKQPYSHRTELDADPDGDCRAHGQPDPRRPS